MGDRCLVKLHWVSLRKIRQVSMPSQVWSLLKMSAANNRDTILRERRREKDVKTFYIHHQHRNRRSETSITHFCIRKDGQEYACFVLLREKKCLYFYYETIIVSDDAHFISKKDKRGRHLFHFIFFGFLNKLILPESRSMHQSCRRRSFNNFRTPLRKTF